MESQSTQPAPASKAVTPRVVYVLGAGKSGSTIFGVTLGNCEGMFFTGELFSWLVESGVPVLSGDERTDFWRGVSDEVNGADALFGTDVVRYLERSLAPFRLHRTRSRRRMRPAYRRVTRELFQAISRSAEAAYVIDTSHFPMRARELGKIDGLDVYLVFLTRDPRDVVASYSRHVKGPSLRRALVILNTNADLWLTYLLSVLVFLRHRRDRRMLLRYEDFVGDPEHVLRAVLQRVDSPAAVPDLRHLRTGLALRGNRLLLSDEVAFEARASARPRRSLLTTFAQLPWMLILPRLRPTAAASANGVRHRRNGSFGH